MEPGPSSATLRLLRLTTTVPSVIDERLPGGLSCFISSAPSGNDISVVALAIKPSSFLEQAVNSGTAARWSVTLVFGMDGVYGIRCLASVPEKCGER